MHAWMFVYMPGRCLHWTCTCIRSRSIQVLPYMQASVIPNLSSIKGQRSGRDRITAKCPVNVSEVGIRFTARLGMRKWSDARGHKSAAWRNLKLELISYSEEGTLGTWV